VSWETVEPEPADDAAMSRRATPIDPGALLEATPECLVVARADGLIVFANQHVLRLTGFTRDELVGQPVELLLASDLLHGEPGSVVETLCRNRHGETIPVELHLGVIESPDRLLVLTLRDVTELQAGRKARFEAETNFRALVEQISAITYTWTWRDDAYVVVFASPQIEAILGYTPEEWAADPPAWYEWVHPEDRSSVIAENKRCERTAEAYTMVYRMIRKDGRIIWVEDSWVVVEDEADGHRLFQGVVFDVTERKQTEESLRAHTDRLNKILATHRDIAAAGMNPYTMMNLICERTQELTGGGSASVLVVEDEEYVFKAATGFMSDRVGDRVPIEGTLTGWVQRNGEATICNDTETDPRASLARAAGIRSMVVVPLIHGEESVGQIQVYSHAPNAFTKEDLNTLELLRVVLSSAMSQAAELAAKREQIEALARFQIVYQGAAIGMTIVSADARNIAANPAFEEMLGYTSEELATMTIRDYTHPDDIEHNLEVFDEMMAGERDFYRLEKRFYRKDGGLVWGQVAAALERDAEGKPKFVISMVENITERKQAEEQIRYIAYHDKLTALPNRILFEEMLEMAISRARRHDLGVGVIYLDLDNFKLVNDSLGHHAGDLLLVQLADRLRACTRETDLVARQGGDEFLLLLSDLDRGPVDAPSGIDSALAVAESVAARVHDALRTPFDLNGTEFFVSGSMGISLFPQDAADADTLLKNADAAMYQSKKFEPGGHVVYATGGEDPLEKLSLTTRLRRAVDQEHWVLHYQPIVDLGSGQMKGVEALVRWQQPNGGLVPPGEFIPLAEELGLIEAIGDWVMDEMLMQQLEWARGGLDLEMSFNLSPRQLWSPHLAEKILGKLRVAGVDPRKIVVEITESTAMADPDRTQKILSDLHAWGLTIAIDDFGTGYSSLARLKHMPVDILKIDQAFVRNVDKDLGLAGMVRAMIQLAQSLNMTPLAEGIETHDEFVFLRSNGCRLAQGFHFSTPVPAEEIPALAARDGGLFPAEASTPP
jgi:diguanylate cyclase (GGDEF)-like protein/PAS domain S-box-containing protein